MATQINVRGLRTVRFKLTATSCLRVDVADSGFEVFEQGAYWQSSETRDHGRQVMRDRGRLLDNNLRQLFNAAHADTVARRSNAAAAA
eukprot:713180-Rhodomonas_salina.1